MKKHNYRVQGYFDFVMLGSSPRQLQEKMLHIIKREGLIETNFDIKVEREEKTAQCELNKAIKKQDKGKTKKISRKAKKDVSGKSKTKKD